MRDFYRRHRRGIVFLICLVLVAASVLGVYAGRVYTTRTSGVILSPTRDYEPVSLARYQQNDARWSEQAIGTSAERVGGNGCLIACVASSMAALGGNADPGVVNERLKGVGGFDGADLVWHKIHEAFPSFDYRYSRLFTAATLEKDLENGLWPIVRVRLASGVDHWLLVVGARDGVFLVLDPLVASAEPLSLTSYGRVFAYRVIVRAEAI